MASHRSPIFTFPKGMTTFFYGDYMRSKVADLLIGLRSHLKDMRSLKKPDVIVGNRGSLGDAILLTTLLHEMSRRGKTAAVLTDTPELYANLPYVFSCIPKNTPVITISQTLGIPIHYITYATAKQDEKAEIPPRQHIMAEMCLRAGLYGDINLRPYFSLTDEECAAAARFCDCVAIQSSCLTAKFRMWTKEWGVTRMQRVVDGLSPRQQLVQLGSAKDPRLDGALDMRGAPLRQAAAILSQCSLFVGLVGFLMHLARAVETRAVIIYGGRELPSQSGYVANLNLASDVPCAPCWRYDDCAGNKVCMDMITPAAVINAVEEVLNSPREELAVDKVELLN